MQVSFKKLHMSKARIKWINKKMNKTFKTICLLIIQNVQCMVCISVFKNCLRKDEKIWTLSGQVLDAFHPLNFKFKQYAGACACLSLVFV